MSPIDPTESEPSDSLLEKLVARCFATMANEGDAAFERVCAEHPEHAHALRERLAELSKVGLMPAGGGQPRPDTIGPYKILDTLGEGGMGTVYLAEQKIPVRRRVALKVIKLGMDSKQVVARFQAERQALAMMEHDNIAKVFDAGTTERGQPYFVMEHVRGLPITEHCDKHRLPTKERLKLFQQVCTGVQHAHQKGVIHRDLKPSNILVTASQGHAVPKIIDFGVARATDHRLVEATIYTEEGRMIGTPEYMSPEQAEMSAQDIDTRTDIYSLGVILYQLLIGDLPFRSEELRHAGLLEIQRKIRENEPPKPSTRLTTRGTDTEGIAEQRATTAAGLLREVRGDLDWIVIRALEKDRARRYGTANELAADLDRHLEHEPVQAGPPSAGYRLKKLVRRHRVQAAALAAILATVVCGMTAIAIVELRARKAVEDALAETRWQNYAARISAAQASLDHLPTEEVHSILDSCQEDLRDWEWGYLRYGEPAGRWFRVESPNTIAFHPDKTILVGSDDQVLVLEASSGAVRTRIPTSGSVVRLDLSDDGSRLVGGGARGQIWVWDDLRPRRIEIDGFESSESEFFGSSAQVQTLDISRNGDRIAAVSKSGEVAVWDAVSGERLFSGHQEGHASWAALTPDGQRLVVAGENEVEVWQVHPAEQLHEWGHISLRPPYLLSPDGTQIAACRVVQGSTTFYQVEVRELETWDDPNRKSSGPFRAPSPPQWDPAPGETQQIVALHFDGEFTSMREGEAIRILGTENSVERGDVTFSPDGRIAVLGSDGIRLAGSVQEGPAFSLVRFSPDGSRIATAGGGILIHNPDLGWSTSWDPPNWNLQHSASFAAFSPDGRRIVTAGSDYSSDWSDSLVRVADVTTGELLMILRGHAGTVTSASFSPDGRHVFSVSRDRSARVWNGSGECIQTLDLTRLGSHDAQHAWSPDGRQIALVGGSDELMMWNPETGALDTAVKDGESLQVVAFHPDGTHLATGSASGTLSIWDTATLQEQSRPAHGDALTAIDFSPSGSRFVSGSDDGTARIWQWPRSDPILTLRSPGGAVRSLDFSPDDTRIAVGAVDGPVRIWDSRPSHVIRAQQAAAAAAQQTAPEPFMSFEAEKALIEECWDILSTPDRGLGEYERCLERLQELNAGEWVADWLRMLAPALYRTQRYEQVRSLLSRLYRIDFRFTGLAISPTGTMLATATRESAIRLRDTRTWRVLHELEEEYGKDLAFARNGEHLLSLGWRDLCKWDTSNGECIAEWEDHMAHDISTCPSRDDLPIVALQTRSVAMIDPSTGHLLEPLREDGDTPGDSPLCLEHSADGRWVAAGFVDGTVRVWDTSTQSVVSEIESMTPVGALAISPNGGQVAYGESWTDSPREWWETPPSEFEHLPEGFRVFLTDLESGRPGHPLPGHTQPITSLAFHPNGTRIASASEGGSLRIVDIKTAAVVAEGANVEVPVRKITFSPDGDRIYTAADDAAVRVYDGRSGEMEVAIYDPLPLDWWGPEGYAPSHRPKAVDLAFLAMSLHRLGDEEQAQRAMAQLRLRVQPLKAKDKQELESWEESGRSRRSFPIPRVPGRIQLLLDRSEAAQDERLVALMREAEALLATKQLDKTERR